MTNELNICDYIKGQSDDDILVDLRDQFVFEFGSLPGAINIPMDNLKELYSLPSTKKIYLFCQSGEFSEQITELLCDDGYEAYNLTGGYREYLRSQANLENNDSR